VAQILHFEFNGSPCVRAMTDVTDVTVEAEPERSLEVPGNDVEPSATTIGPSTMATVEERSQVSATLKKVEKLVQELQDQFREQAMGASQNKDLVQAQEEMKSLMVDASDAQRRLEQVPKAPWNCSGTWPKRMTEAWW